MPTRIAPWIIKHHDDLVIVKKQKVEAETSTFFVRCVVVRLQNI